MITITSVNQEGKASERLYDNRRVAFFTPEGQRVPVPLKKMPQPMTEQGMGTGNAQCNCAQDNGERPSPTPVMTEEKKRKYFTRIRSDSKSPNVRLLKIQMGLACNYSCSYCKQAIHVSGAQTSSSADVDHFIATFDDWCTAPTEDEIVIQLWGGEPLINFNKMQKLVKFLRSRFEKARISTLSNGSLVNEAIVDFLIENDVVLAISHDGPGQKTTRKEDPLAEGSESLKWIRNYVERSKTPLYVNMVLSKQNHDAKAGVDYIKSILGQSVQAGYEGIVQVEDEAQFDESSMFSDEDYEALRHQFTDAIRAGQTHNISPFNRKFDELLRCWASNSDMAMVFDNTFQKCGMDDAYTLAVNLKGDALVCHSVNTKIGHVSEFKGIKLSDGGVEHWSIKEECRACPVLSMCRGSCMNQHGSAWYYTCNNEFHFNLAIFEAAFELAFAEKIIHLGGDFVRPQKPRVVAIADGAGTGRPGMTPCAS